ncbi:hypothetical protein BJV78DRAFT_1287259 [Lactifluus subvellereus]|nr:hypothetical protein BJV78DRAFT_1287259 [Lactifluus subvellereus]
MSLFNDLNYQRLVVLLHAVKDGDLLEVLPPPWASWASMDRYLSNAYYNTMSSSSLSTFCDWTSTDPITADGNLLASYEQVELVILSFGLTFRGLWVAQFPDQYPQVPDHVLNSPYSFLKYDKPSCNIENLISGYAHVIQDIKAGHPHLQPPKKKSPMSGTPDADIKQSSPDSIVKVPLDSMSNKHIPPTLQPFHEELGLAGADWDTFGHNWQALATLWLCAETSVSKSSQADLTIAEIHSSSIPDEWKEQVLTEYLSRLPPSVFKAGGNPSEAPDAFLNHLKVLNLNLGLEIFTHYQTRPSEASDGCLDEARAKSWCGEMDMLLGKLHWLEKSQPEHQALLSAIGKLGAKGITKIDEQLAEQKKADTAAKEKYQDRVEQLHRLDSERAAFEHAKQELALKEKAFQDAQKSVVGDNDNDGNGNDDDDKDDDEGMDLQKPTKRELEQETCHGKLPQVMHLMIPPSIQAMMLLNALPAQWSHTIPLILVGATISNLTIPAIKNYCLLQWDAVNGKKASANHPTSAQAQKLSVVKRHKGPPSFHQQLDHQISSSSKGKVLQGRKSHSKNKSIHGTRAGRKGKQCKHVHLATVAALPSPAFATVAAISPSGIDTHTVETTQPFVQRNEVAKTFYPSFASVMTLTANIGQPATQHVLKTLEQRITLPGNLDPIPLQQWIGGRMTAGSSRMTDGPLVNQDDVDLPEHAPTPSGSLFSFEEYSPDTSLASTLHGTPCNTLPHSTTPVHAVSAAPFSVQPQSNEQIWGELEWQRDAEYVAYPYMEYHSISPVHADDDVISLMEDDGMDWAQFVAGVAGTNDIIQDSENPDNMMGDLYHFD